MKLHKSFVLPGNIHSIQSHTTCRCPRFYRIQHNIFSDLKVSQKTLGCFADRQKIYGNRHWSADRRLRTTAVEWFISFLTNQFKHSVQNSQMLVQRRLWKRGTEATARSPSLISNLHGDLN